MAHAFRTGDVSRAYQIARGPNPFASCCGNGCHAPCESVCRRRHLGAPVAIAALEAHAATVPMHALLASPAPCTSAHDARSVAGLVGRTLGARTRTGRSGRRVAIIGAGAAGLACAHDLALLGHECAIFDAAEEPGGLLTAALPAFRFPVEHARAESAAILAMGPAYHRRTRIASADGIRALEREGFHAVFIAIGASDASGPVVEHQTPHAAVIDAMDVLTSTAPQIGRVVVIGEGDLALDAARVLVRRARHNADAQATTVHLVIATKLEETTLSPAALADALCEGVALHHGWRPRRLLTERDKSLVPGIEVTRDVGEITKVIPCDRLVVAAPRVPAADFLDETLARTASGFIATDPDTMQTSLPGVWAGGACAFGHRSIAHAVADGKRAAWQIHAALAGVRVQVQLSSAWVEVDDRDRDHTRRALATPRAAPQPSSATSADAASGGDADAARAEIVRQAARCYDCTVLPHVDETCTECGTCVSVCPVGAFTLAPDGDTRLHFDQEPCTRCGVCADRCPEGAISMVRAVWEERLVSERVTRSRRRAV